MHGARLELDDEEDHDADGAEHAQRLDAEEVASVQRLPVARDELLPSPRSTSLRRRFDARIGQNVRDRRTADLDLQPTQGVPDLRVAPTDVLGRQLEHELAEVARLARPAGLPASVRAIVLLGRELPKPRENGGRAHDLTAGRAFRGRQRLPLECRPASLLRRERDSGLARRCHEGLLQQANLFL